MLLSCSIVCYVCVEHLLSGEVKLVNVRGLLLSEIIIALAVVRCGKSEPVIYVSQVSGNDTTSCGYQSSPCRTISYAVYQAPSQSTIILDSTNTTQNPYKCQPLTSKHRGIYINKCLSFIGMPSRAHIACDQGQYWLINGTNSFNQISINLTKLVFENPRLHFIESSVNVIQSSFLKTKNVVMNFTSPFAVLFDNVVFQDNEACLLLTDKSVNLEKRQMYIDIRNSVFNRNGLSNIPGLSTVESTVLWLECAKANIVNLRIRNTSFHENFVRAKGMMYIKNELGQINLSLESSNLIANGRLVTRATNSLFVLYSKNLTLVIEALQSFKNIVRLFSITGSLTQVNLSDTVIDDFMNWKPYGGLFYMVSNELDLFMDNCSFNNKNTIYSHGGAVFISGKYIHIRIESCNFTNLRTRGYGGVLYISTKYGSTVTSAVVAILFSHFTSNSAVARGGVLYFDVSYYSDVSAIVDNCRFLSNMAGGYGGVMRFSTVKKVKITISNSLFERNRCANGGVMSLTQSSDNVSGTFFGLEVSNVTFLHNQASGPGGVFYLETSDVTSISFRLVSFVENLSWTAPGGVLYVCDSPYHSTMRNAFLNLQAIDVFFIKNTAAVPGGALYLEFELKLAYAYFKNAIFVANSANAPGGVMYVASSSKGYININVTDCSFFQNNSSTVGGAIYMTGSGSFYSFNSIFQSNTAVSPGGAILLQLTNSSIGFVNTTFLNNSCIGAAGGAVYIDISKNSCVSMTDTTFHNNTAVRAIGGAVFIKMADDKLNQSGCKMSSPTWLYNNTVYMRDTHFEGNIATGGGALSVTNGAVTFQNCTFVNNFASAQGGHISNYGSNRLEIRNSVFLQTIAHVEDFHLPSFVQTYSAGPFVFVNTTVDQQTQCTSDPLIMVSKGGLVEFNNFSSVICPRGSFASKLNLSYPNRVNDSCTIQVTVLRLLCQECSPGYYSLQRGHTEGLTVVQDFVCISCPSGAECSQTIKSKPNFWGYLAQQNPPALNFTLCPSGYCRSPKRSNVGYNSCHESRHGWMCGECAPGYTETLFSTECRLTEKCTDRWFWSGSFALVLIIALFLIIKPPIITLAVKQVMWFRRFFVGRKHMPTVENNETISSSFEGSPLLISTEEIQYEKNQSVGFLEIIFNFYQISNLLLTSTSVDELVGSKLIPPVVGLFNFQERFSSRGLVCPFPGLTPQTKKLFEVAPVVGTLVAIYLIYAIHWFIYRVVKRTAPNLGPYLGATMETLLLGYATVANVSLSLVRCVPVGSEMRWFYNGSVVCFQWWQYLLIAYNIAVVIPFILVLAWGSVKLHHGKVSAKCLLLACAFPLPFLVYWLFCLVRRDIGTSQQIHYAEALKQVLHEPFRGPETSGKGALYWESVIIGRRLVLIFLYCFITDPALRLFCMILVCVLAVSHHLKVKPFRNPNANTAETVSLLCLVLLSVINMYKTVVITTEGQITGPLVTVFLTFDWIEVLVLGILPVIILLLMTLGILSLASRVVFTFFRFFREKVIAVSFCKLSSGDSDPLLDVAN